MKFCFRLHGVLYCITIPILVVDPLHRRPDPEGPQPEPWLTREGKEIEAARDLQALAAIDTLAQTLSESSQKAVRSGLDHALSQLKSQLPEGFEIHSAKY